MDQLPGELLTAIFYFLHQEDKVECMTVCRHWKEIIQTSSLFHTVRISYLENFDILREKLSEEPNQAAKVERLFIDVYYDEDVYRPNLEALLLLLPNLRIFSIVEEYSEITLEDRSDYPFCNNIECIAETTRDSIVKSILQYNICPQLTTLSFCQSGNKNVYSLLKNAPQLRTLDVYYGSMKLMHFETIHENAPLLTSLSINMIKVHDAEINFNVTPASLVTKLIISRLSGSFDFQRKGFLPYIRKKYPNLAHLAYDVSMEHRPGTNDCLDDLLHTINSNLQSLSITSFGHPTTPCRFLREGAWCNPPLEQNVSLPSSVDQAVFSNAIHVIQSLRLWNVTTDTFDGLKKFTSLKEVVLKFDTKESRDDISGKEVKVKQNVRFQDVLDSCPSSVRCLTLKYVEIEPIFSDTIPYLIESLTLDQADLPSHIDTFVSRHFPKLSTLIMKGSELKGIKFVLPNMDLFRFQFGKYDLYYSDSILVSTLKNNERRRYTLMNCGDHSRIYYPGAGDFDDPIYLPVKSSLDSGNETDAYFTLVCNSVIHVDLKPELQKYIQYL